MINLIVARESYFRQLFLNNMYIILVILTLVQLVLIALVKYPSLKDLNYSIFIFKNWKSPLIRNFTLKANLSSKCPEGFMNLNLGFYPGILKGCNCAQSNEKYQYLKNYTENFNKKIFNNTYGCSCEEIASKDAFHLYKWNNNFICAQYFDNFQNYLNISSDNKKYICDNYQKDCGIIDSMGRKLCYALTETCPINDVKIINKREIRSNDYENYTQIDMDLNKKFVFTNEKTNGTLTVEYNIFSNEDQYCTPKIYPLLRSAHNKLWCSYDNNDLEYRPTEFATKKYSSIGTEFLTFFLKEYGLYDKIFNLPKFPKGLLSNKYIYLKGINYIYFNESCFNDYSTQINTILNYDFEKIILIDFESNQLKIVILEFFSVIISFQFILDIISPNKSNKNKHSKNKISLRNAEKGIIILLIFNTLTYLLSSLLWKDFIPINLIIKFPNNTLCLEEFIYNIMNEYQKEFKQTSFYFELHFYMTLFNLGISATMMALVLIGLIRGIKDINEKKKCITVDFKSGELI